MTTLALPDDYLVPREILGQRVRLLNLEDELRLWKRRWNAAMRAHADYQGPPSQALIAMLEAICETTNPEGLFGLNPVVTTADNHDNG